MDFSNKTTPDIQVFDDKKRISRRERNNSMLETIGGNDKD